MQTVCMRCYDEGLVSFVESRSHRISQVTANTYLGDGRRFKNFFIEGYMRVKGNSIRTVARGVDGHVGLDEMSEFLAGLVMGEMAVSSADVYKTPIEGAFAFAPSCEHQ